MSVFKIFKLKYLIKTLFKKETILWKALSLVNETLYFLFKNKISKNKINTFIRNLKPDQELKVIFGGHWYSTDEWLILTEDYQDIRKPLKFPNKSVDVIFSEHVIEHVEFTDALTFFRESKRILKPNGVMIHNIDCSDHFSHSDKSISKINFLKYSDDEFRKYNSKFLYQNRLRASEYRDLLSECGYKIIYWKNNIDEDSLKIIEDFPLSSRYISLDHVNLCTTNILTIAEPI